MVQYDHLVVSDMEMTMENLQLVHRLHLYGFDVKKAGLTYFNPHPAEYCLETRLMCMRDCVELILNVLDVKIEVVEGHGEIFSDLFAGDDYPEEIVAYSMFIMVDFKKDQFVLRSSDVDELVEDHDLKRYNVALKDRKLAVDIEIPSPFNVIDFFISYLQKVEEVNK